MREYELTVVYDLAVQEAGGAEAGPQHLTTLIESRNGKVLNIDHWGRRRLAYPIGRAIDADYVVSRIELDPTAVSALEAALTIDEKVFRHLVVRADELPVPPPPREPRRAPLQEAEAVAPSAEEAPVASETVATEPVAEADVPTTVAEESPAENVALEPPATDYTADATAATDEAPAAPAEEAPAAEPQA